MCLDSRYSNTRKQEFIKDIPKKGLKVYKVVGVHKADKYISPYVSPCFGSGYQIGANVIKEQKIIGDCGSLRYKSGFHFFQLKESAEAMLKWCHENVRSDFKVIECIVKKSWITDVGIENQWGRQATVVIVAKKAIFS